MLFNPRYRTVGLFAMPYFVFFEMLGPLVELVGYVLTVGGLALGFILPEVAALFFIVSVLFGMVLSVGSVLLDDLTARRLIRLRSTWCDWSPPRWSRASDSGS